MHDKVTLLSWDEAKTLPVGTYFTTNDSHWRHEVRRRTQDGYVSIAWCSDWSNAVLVARALNHV